MIELGNLYYNMKRTKVKTGDNPLAVICHLFIQKQNKKSPNRKAPTFLISNY